MKFLKVLLGIVLALVLGAVGLLTACVIDPDLSQNLGEKVQELTGQKIEIPFITKKDSPSTDFIPETPLPTAYNPGVDTTEYNTIPDADYPFKYQRYIVPENLLTDVPDKVASYTGSYEEPVQKLEDIDNSAAESIAENLGYGNTVADFEHDPQKYPYYYMLNEKEKALYEQVLANANALIDRFAPVTDCTTGSLTRVMEAVFNDHPELFWLDKTYGCKRTPDGKIVEINLTFLPVANNLTESKAMFDEAAEKILEGARNLGSDFDKEKYVHDMLANQTDYNLSAPMNQSAFSALVGRSSVCAGYSRAFQYLMQQLGIPCYYCSGYAGGNHAWNIVKLGDDYYNVDLTWDDSAWKSYDYFNKNDYEFNPTHIRKNLSVNLPACKGTGNQAESDPGIVSFNPLPENDDTDGENNEYTAPVILRSLRDTGFSDKAVIYSIYTYYDNCVAQILRHGKGSFTFTNVVAGTDNFNEIANLYNSGAYKIGMMNTITQKLGAKECIMNLGVEQLQGDLYLITHKVFIQ